MKRIITGLTLVNYTEDLKEIPKLKDNINYFVEVNKENNKYEINYANLFEPILLSPFVKEGLLLPFWVFEFIKKVFSRFLSKEESILLDMLLEVGEELSEMGVTESLRIRNYVADSREFYKFRFSIYNILKEYGQPIESDSLLRRLIIGLLSWKRDKEMMEIYNNAKNKVGMLYRPDWDYFLRAVYVFALSEQKDLTKLLDLYYNSEKNKTNFYKDSIPTFAFARLVGYEKHIKNKEVEVNFCRIGTYEDLTDINIFFPEKLLKTFELENSLTEDIKHSIKEGKTVTKDLKEIIIEELDASPHIEGVLGFMGVYIDAYNDFRALINLPPIKLKYYIISKDAIIYKTTEDFGDIMDYIEQNNHKIKRLLRDSGIVRATVGSEILSGLKNDRSLSELSSELNSPASNILRKIQINAHSYKLMYEILEEEEDMEISPKDKTSFFYNTDVSESLIQEFIRVIKSKHTVKKVEVKEIPYSLLKKAVKSLLKGAPYLSVINQLKYDDNFVIEGKKLKNELEIYFGEEVIERIKIIQNKKLQGKF